jgi:hypothetical protein
LRLRGCPATGYKLRRLWNLVALIQLAVGLSLTIVDSAFFQLSGTNPHDVLMTLKMAVSAPMPSAIVTIAIAGLFMSVRMA